MTADTLDNDAALSAPSHVEHDLPCAKCKYNLRTLAWDAVCPECGAPVLGSGQLIGFPFETTRSLRNFRIAISLLAIAFLIKSIGCTIGVAAFRFYYVMPPWILRLAISCWGWRDLLSTPFVAAAIVLIVWPRHGALRGFRPALTKTTGMLAILGLADHFAAYLLYRFGGVSWDSPLGIRIVTSITWLFLSAALFLATMHILLRIDRRSQAAASCVAWGAVCSSLTMLTGRAVNVSAVVFIPGGSIVHSWQSTLSDIGQLWWNHGEWPCGLLLLVALFFILRCTQRAPRVPS